MKGKTSVYADALTSHLFILHNMLDDGGHFGPYRREMLRHGSPYWMARDVVSILRESVSSFAAGGLAEWEPPTPAGWCLLESPADVVVPPVREKEIPVRGFGWAMVPSGCWVATLVGEEHDDDVSGPFGMYFLPMGTSRSVPGHDRLSEFAPGAQLYYDSLARFLRSMWAFMRQPIASVARHHPDRANARRIEKVYPSAEQKLINVIQLRRTVAIGDAGDRKHEYSCRWVVRAHWRMQPCGPRNSERKPVMVVAHIKGSPDAPLKVRGVDVFAVTR